MLTRSASPIWARISPGEKSRLSIADEMPIAEWKTNMISKIREHSSKIVKEAEANAQLAKEDWPIRFWRRVNENGNLRAVASGWMFEKRLAEILANFDRSREVRSGELKSWLQESDKMIIDWLDTACEDFTQFINLFGSTYSTPELDSVHEEFRKEHEELLEKKLEEREIRLSREPSRFDSEAVSQFMSMNLPRYILSARSQ